MGENGIYSGWNWVDGHRLWIRVPEWMQQDSAWVDEKIPMVLVHGMGLSSRSMKPTIRELGADWPVFAPDLPGFGMSDDPTEVLDVTGLALALRRWMLSNNLDRVTVIGSSLGCQVAVDLAAGYPELVERLVLAGPAIDPEARDPTARFTRRLKDALKESPVLAPTLIRDFVDCGPWRLQQTLELAMTYPLEQELPHVEAPTLVVRGERDPMVSQEWAEQVAELVPEAEQQTLPKAPHLLTLSAAPALAEAVREFLSHDFPEKPKRRKPRRKKGRTKKRKAAVA
jgi:2-hydroxy-6-oxonona-2,4-dienedioate hydrolase